MTSTDLTLVVAAYVVGAVLATRPLHLPLWIGGTLGLVGVVAFVGARSIPGLDTSIPFLAGILGTGVTGQFLGLNATQTGLVITGGAIAAALGMAASALL